MVATLTYLRTAPATLGRRRGVWSRARGVWEVLENTSYAKDVCSASLDGLGRFHNPTIYLFISGVYKSNECGRAASWKFRIVVVNCQTSQLILLMRRAHCLRQKTPSWVKCLQSRLDISNWNTDRLAFFAVSSRIRAEALPRRLMNSQTDSSSNSTRKWQHPSKTNLSPLPLFSPSSFFSFSYVWSVFSRTSGKQRRSKFLQYLRMVALFFFRQLRRIWHSIEIIRKS